MDDKTKESKNDKAKGSKDKKLKHVTPLNIQPDMVGSLQPEAPVVACNCDHQTCGLWG
jgi:hypothetical protein